MVSRKHLRMHMSNLEVYSLQQISHISQEQESPEKPSNQQPKTGQLKVGRPGEWFFFFLLSTVQFCWVYTQYSYQYLSLAQLTGSGVLDCSQK